MKLAIHGGLPIRTKPFPRHNTIGKEEKDAVNSVMESGVLSKYLGSWHEDFLGGHQIRELEAEWAEYFNVKHAITVNSCTSGLICAVGAIGTEPGDEIIVPPYTMSATATAALMYNAIPIFADIEPAYFCIDPISIEKQITPRTKAIIAVDLFGHPYNFKAISQIAKKHGLKIIEDTAQAPGACDQDRFAGTLGDIGVFSLNYHKHIHCGEGGIIVTDDETLADRVRLIRNHAEAVVEAKGTTDLNNMIGFNFRMTEIEAAIARCQLKKLSSLLEKRINNTHYLARRLDKIPAITTAKTREGCKHAYYVHANIFNEKIAGISRDIFISAVKAELPVFTGRETEGVKISTGYVKPIYSQPLYQQKKAYGKDGFPFNLQPHQDDKNYDKGNCPVCEMMYEKKLFIHEMIVPSMSETDLDDVANAFEKVWENRHMLKGDGYGIFK